MCRESLATLFYCTRTARSFPPSSGWMLIQQGAKVVKQLFLDQACGTTYVSWWTPIGQTTPPCWPIAGRHLFAGATLKYALRFLLRQPARWSVTGSTSLGLSTVKRRSTDGENAVSWRSCRSFSGIQRARHSVLP